MSDPFVSQDADMRAIYMLGSTGFKPLGILTSPQQQNGNETSTPFALIDLDLFKLLLEALCSNVFIIFCLVLVFCYSSAINVIYTLWYSLLYYLTWGN